MSTIRPRRSALYMPGANARALEKARTLDADVLILDLEDAVAPEKKHEARGLIHAALAEGGYDGREIVIRTNGVDTAEFAADLALIAAARPDALLVPKVSSVADVAAVRAAMLTAGVERPFWAMIETPLGVLNCADIAKASGAASGERCPLTCFVIGTNDLVKDTGASLDANRSAAAYWLSATVTAAKAYGLTVLDGVYNAFKDMDGYQAECRHGRMFGMDGKTLIHPSQIAFANDVFGPDAETVAWSRKVIAAFKQPENQGRGVITMDGQMVELLHAEIAERVVAMADLIAARAK